MNKEVYECADYKSYLGAILDSAGARSGIRMRIAKAIGCHTAYITQVTKYDAHFSLEQAEKLNRFLGHTKEEGQFFLLLVQKGRAGTRELQIYFEEQLQEMRSKRMVIQNRLKTSNEIPALDQSTYYGSWEYAAVHVALSIPGLNTKESIASYLGICISQVSAVLNFLISIGLVSYRAGRYSKEKTNVHLGKNSPNLKRHHTNWRTQAILSLDRDEPEDLHYSAAVTLSQKDTFKVREILIRAIKESTELIAESKEENVFCLSADFFKMKR